MELKILTLCFDLKQLTLSPNKKRQASAMEEEVTEVSPNRPKCRCSRSGRRAEPPYDNPGARRTKPVTEWMACKEPSQPVICEKKKSHPIPINRRKSPRMKVVMTTMVILAMLPYSTTGSTSVDGHATQGHQVEEKIEDPMGSPQEDPSWFTSEREALCQLSMLHNGPFTKEQVEMHEKAKSARQGGKPSRAEVEEVAPYRDLMESLLKLMWISLMMKVALFAFLVLASILCRVGTHRDCQPTSSMGSEKGSQTHEERDPQTKGGEVGAEEPKKGDEPTTLAVAWTDRAEDIISNAEAMIIEAEDMIRLISYGIHEGEVRGGGPIPRQHH